MTTESGAFDPGRYIRFPNVSKWMRADEELAYYQRHIRQDIGETAFPIEQSDMTTFRKDGEVVSEFIFSPGRKLRLRTRIGFKTAAIILDLDDRVITRGPEDV